VAATTDAARQLARRLRQLRTQGFPGEKLTQPMLAGAFKVSVPLISSWENGSDPTPPPQSRLSAYAQLFCTRRSLDNGRLRLIEVDSLTADEYTRYAELERELSALRRAAAGHEEDTQPGGAGGPWQFPADQNITLICAELPADFRRKIPYSDPDDPDYIAAYRYADLDALIELHGHIRANNPHNQVNIRLATEMATDDYTSHLVLLGGVDWNVVTSRVLDTVEVPVAQRSSYEDGRDVAAFEVREGPTTRHFAPVLHDRPRGARVLVEDVAHFYRGPNPYNRLRTVSICNGIFGRGTLAAVRTLTDSRFRDRNAAHLLERFGDGDTYSVLSRVLIVGTEVLTPDWTAPDTVLHEWPEVAA
jgi:hypothetical protein